MGCDRGQGFLFGPPLPLEEALERTAPHEFTTPAPVTRVS
jgi:EAL domain-containing protein (putative c-di-GMP-specific phosphodiesterase class I)